MTDWGSSPSEMIAAAEDRTLFTAEQTNLQPRTMWLRRMVKSPLDSGCFDCSFRTCLVSVIRSVRCASAAWSMAPKSESKREGAPPPLPTTPPPGVPSRRKREEGGEAEDDGDGGACAYSATCGAELVGGKG